MERGGGERRKYSEIPGKLTIKDGACRGKIVKKKSPKILLFYIYTHMTTSEKSTASAGSL